MGGKGKGISLAGKGAKSLALLSRSGVVHSDSQHLFEKISTLATACPCDIASAKDATRIMQRVSGDLPLVRGFIHSADALGDHLIL